MKKQVPPTKYDDAHKILEELRNKKNMVSSITRGKPSSVRHLPANTVSTEEKNISEISKNHSFEDNLTTWTEQLTSEFIKSSSILIKNESYSRECLQEWITNLILDILIKMSSHSLKGLEHISAKVSELIESECQKNVIDSNNNQECIKEIIETCVSSCLSKMTTRATSEKELDNNGKNFSD